MDSRLNNNFKGMSRESDGVSEFPTLSPIIRKDSWSVGNSRIAVSKGTIRKGLQMCFIPINIYETV